MSVSFPYLLLSFYKGFEALCILKTQLVSFIVCFDVFLIVIFTFNFQGNFSLSYTCENVVGK